MFCAAFLLLTMLSRRARESSIGSVSRVGHGRIDGVYVGALARQVARLAQHGSYLRR